MTTQELRADIKTLLAAFDAKIFVRNTEHDDERMWAAQILRPMAALARLQKFSEETEP